MPPSDSLLTCAPSGTGSEWTYRDGDHRFVARWDPRDDGPDIAIDTGTWDDGAPLSPEAREQILDGIWSSGATRILRDRGVAVRWSRGADGFLLAGSTSSLTYETLGHSVTFGVRVLGKRVFVIAPSAPRWSIPDEPITAEVWKQVRARLSQAREDAFTGGTLPYRYFLPLEVCEPAPVEVAQVREQLDAIIDALKASGAWDIAPPQEAARPEIGPFGERAMAFEQWLRWVFVPNVEDLIAGGGPWPRESSVAVRATREGDTNSFVAALIPALRRFDELFNDREASAQAAYERARRALGAKDHEQAWRAIQRALAMDPGWPNAQNQAGWILLSWPNRTAEQLEDAIGYFERARELAPGDTTPLANWGKALVELGREGEAMAMMRAEIPRGPAVAAAHNWLGWRLTHHHGDFINGVAHLREAVRLAPGFAAPRDNLVWAYESRLTELGWPPPDYVPVNLVALALMQRTAALPGVEADPAGPSPRRFALHLARRTSRPEELPYAIIGTVRDNLAARQALLFQDDRFDVKGHPAPSCFALLPVLAAGLLCFRRFEVGEGRLEEAAQALGAWIAQTGESQAINPIEIAVALLDALGKVQPALPAFALRPDEQPDPTAPATLWVEHGLTLQIAIAAHRPAGVDLRLSSRGEPPWTLSIDSAAQFQAALPEVVAWLQREAARPLEPTGGAPERSDASR